MDLAEALTEDARIELFKEELIEYYVISAEALKTADMAKDKAQLLLTMNAIDVLGGDYFGEEAWKRVKEGL